MLRFARAVLKKVAARLPHGRQQQLKRHYFAGQIRRGTFGTTDPEFRMLSLLVGPGDWVIDVGANVGHYTLQLSRLVGATGRVIAFEPMPETFELLAANVQLAPFANVTLVNAAASDETAIAGMSVPQFADSGLRDFYSARLDAGAAGVPVLCLSIDALRLSHPVRLVKIDAEGHDLAVLRGMRRLLLRDRPTLIVEDTNTRSVSYFLASLGYDADKVSGSDNRVYTARSRVPAYAG